MDRLGELFGVYKARTGRFFGLRVGGFALFAIALFALLLFVYAAFFAEGIRFDKDFRWIIKYVIAFLILLASIGALIFYISFKWKPQYFFEVHEKGVVIKRKSADVDLRFDEIEDVIPFVTAARDNLGFEVNNLLFRKNAGSEWFAINGFFKDHLDLIGGFLAQHTEQRGSAQVQEIEATGSTPFKYVEKSALRKSTFSADSFIDPVGGYLKKYKIHKTLYLSNDQIKIDDKTIYLEDTDYLEIGGLTTDTIYIKDAKGKEKFSLPHAALFSPDIFIAILANRIEFKE
ncbi:MAG: hypothetical protein LBQ18_06675 [Campylobacteraceae bacterium]|jgi:hypothetical protein|nr:hypothetical protein [Campylobacteraceae bacterium]